MRDQVETGYVHLFTLSCFRCSLNFAFQFFSVEKVHEWVPKLMAARSSLQNCSNIVLLPLLILAYLWHHLHKTDMFWSLHWLSCELCPMKVALLKVTSACQDCWPHHVKDISPHVGMVCIHLCVHLTSDVIWYHLFCLEHLSNSPLFSSGRFTVLGSRDGAVVRALASYQCDLG